MGIFFEVISLMKKVPEPKTLTRGNQKSLIVTTSRKTPFSSFITVLETKWKKKFKLNNKYKKKKKSLNPKTDRPIKTTPPPPFFFKVSTSWKTVQKRTQDI